jgi:hypothetical protein
MTRLAMSDHESRQITRQSTTFRESSCPFGHFPVPICFTICTYCVSVRTWTGTRATKTESRSIFRDEFECHSSPPQVSVPIPVRRVKEPLFEVTEHLLTSTVRHRVQLYLSDHNDHMACFFPHNKTLTIAQVSRELNKMRIADVRCNSGGRQERSVCGISRCCCHSLVCVWCA